MSVIYNDMPALSLKIELSFAAALFVGGLIEKGKSAMNAITEMPEFSAPIAKKIKKFHKRTKLIASDLREFLDKRKATV